MEGGRLGVGTKKSRAIGRLINQPSKNLQTSYRIVTRRRRRLSAARKETQIRFDTLTWLLLCCCRSCTITLQRQLDSVDSHHSHSTTHGQRIEHPPGTSSLRASTSLGPSCRPLMGSLQVCRTLSVFSPLPSDRFPADRRF